MMEKSKNIMEKPILLEFKQSEFDQFQRFALSLSDKINDFLKKWEAINKELKIDIPVKELVEGCISAGPNYFERIESRYLQDKEKALHKHYSQFFYEKTNQVHEILRGMVQGTIGMGNFPQELHGLSNWHWENDKINPNSDWFESIRKHFEIWAVSQDQKEFVKRYRALKEAFNNLMELSDSKGMRLSGNITALYDFKQDNFTYRLEENYKNIPLHNI